jgi:hypothetical protein
LTEIYRWFAGDFEQVAGTVLDYVARHAPALRQWLAAGGQPTIRWIDYDWSLNAQSTRRSPARANAAEDGR